MVVFSFEDMVMVLVPICIAFSMGVLIGWAWKPTWAIFFWSQKLESCHKFSNNSNSSEELIEMDKGNLHKVVNDEDLEHLCKLVEKRDGGPTWIHMMDRSTPTMTYTAWRRDQKIGPPQYCSSTIFENATPEIVRDFFWDDEFRSNWDDMLANFKTVEECPTTGTMVVHWIRKFPFFYKDREYIIGRRIWKSGRTYYCVTKGVPCSSIPRKDKPRRVDLYSSSWCIRPVESKMGNGLLSACEVLLFHHEEMGISWEIAKLGVKKGMSDLVKKIEPSLRSYQRERALGAPLSQMAFMANINTKIDSNYSKVSILEGSCTEAKVVETEVEKPRGLVNAPKIILIGGAIIFACTFDQGFLAKTLIFGLARTVTNVRKRLRDEKTY